MDGALRSPGSPAGEATFPPPASPVTRPAKFGAAGWEGAATWRGSGRVGSVGAAGRRGDAGGRDDVSGLCLYIRRWLAGLSGRIFCSQGFGRGGGQGLSAGPPAVVVGMGVIPRPPGIFGFSPFAGVTPIPGRFIFPLEASLTSRSKF